MAPFYLAFLVVLGLASASDEHVKCEHGLVPLNSSVVPSFRHKPGFATKRKMDPKSQKPRKPRCTKCTRR
ncbi:hypothetical protein MRX96_005533 [Rhipicephalus microplus]